MLRNIPDQCASFEFRLMVKQSIATASCRSPSTVPPKNLFVWQHMTTGPGMHKPDFDPTLRVALYHTPETPSPPGPFKSIQVRLQVQQQPLRRWGSVHLYDLSEQVLVIHGECQRRRDVLPNWSNEDAVTVLVAGVVMLLRVGGE